MKRIIRRVFKAFGYEIHRIAVNTQTEKNPERRDPFLQQKIFLEGVSNPVIFDVGAHVGTVTTQYRALFPDARIYCFEPFPENYRKLRDSFNADKLVKAYELGLADKSGKVVFHVNAEAMTNSLLATDAAGSSFWGTNVVDTTGEIEVETTTLDTFCEENDVKRIEILKIDTQGAEKLVLEGAVQMLEAKRIAYVYAEMLLVPTYDGQAKFHELIKFLDDRGYKMFSIYNFDYRAGSNRLLQVDALFFSEDRESGQL